MKSVANECKRYILSETAGIGPCIDVKAHRGLIYAIQNSGRLCVLNSELRLLYTYEGIGNARQIEFIGDIAVITARENGLWIFDMSNDKPQLLSHYHTVEYAVGIALCGNLAFVSCRQYGVEIIDISNPKKPFFVSLVRIGEVQSAVVDGNVLYCGVWGEMKVVLVDITSPADAKVISEIPLRGRGDGVCVENGILYAATGQHARGIKNLANENDPCFGNGNGVECFDVKDPCHPVKINEKRFDKAHSLGFDMWEVSLYGDMLVVNDSVLGVYGLDSDTLEKHFVIKPCIRDDAVTGVTSLYGDMFVATGRGDLYAVRDLGLGDQKPNRKETGFPSAPKSFSYSGKGAELCVCHSGNFPVLALDGNSRYLALACAEGGVRILDKDTLGFCYSVNTACEAMDVKLYDDRLYVAEGLGGVEIFTLGDKGAEKLVNFRESKSVNQIKLSESGKYLMCALATNLIRMYDVSDASKINVLYEYRVRKGQLYGNNFADHFLKDGTMLLFCHRAGLIFTNPDAGDREFHCIEYLRKNNFCGYCAGDGIETDGENIFYTLDGGYVLLSVQHEDRFLIDDLPVYCGGSGFKGLISIENGTFIASDRPSGLLYVLDVSDINFPHVTSEIKVTSSPAKAYITARHVLIPGGRDGLLCLETAY